MAYPRPAENSLVRTFKVRRRILIYLGLATFGTGFLWMVEMGLFTYVAALAVTIVQLLLLTSPKLGATPFPRLVLIGTNAVILGIEAWYGPRLTFNYWPSGQLCWAICGVLFIINALGYCLLDSEDEEIGYYPPESKRPENPKANAFNRAVRIAGLIYLAGTLTVATQSWLVYIDAYRHHQISQRDHPKLYLA